MTLIVIVFFVLFAVMLSVGLYLLRRHSENRLLVWGALILFTAAMSGVQVGLEKVVLPYAREAEASLLVLRLLQGATAFFNIAIHTFPYYLILVFFMHFAGTARAFATWLLLIPPLLTFVFTDGYRTLVMDYSYLLSWGVPYMVFSIYLFIRGLLNVGKNRLIKWQSFGIGMVLLVPQLFLLLYQLEGIHFHSPVNLLLYFPLVCLLSLLLGLMLYVYKVFGRFQSDAVLDKMQVGTSLMQHAFKNAISKNKLHALNMRKSLSSGQYESVEKQLAQLLRSNDRLMEMVSKLSYLTRKNLQIHTEMTDLADMLDESIAHFHHKEITFIRQYTSVHIQVDRPLLAECCDNIVCNAVEAMESKGTLTLSIESVGRHVKIHFADSGRGMDSEALKNVFEPFYSTKHKTGQNFGLGLFHVQKIMRAHHGKVDLASQPDKGTTVTLTLPRS